MAFLQQDWMCAHLSDVWMEIKVTAHPLGSSYLWVLCQTSGAGRPSCAFVALRSKAQGLQLSACVGPGVLPC